MRFDYEQAVLKRSKSKGIARLVLMILAVHSNKDGQCWPLVKTIATEANSSIPAVNRAIAQLKDLGEIETSDLRGRGRSSIYKILIPLIDEKTIESDRLTDEKPIENDRPEETKSIENDSLKEKSLSLLERKSIEFDRQNKQEQTIKEEQKTTTSSSSSSSNFDIDFSDCLNLYRNNIGNLSQLQIDDFGAVFDGLSPPPTETRYEWFQYAILEASGNGVNNWKYVKAILENLDRAGSLAKHKEARNGQVSGTTTGHRGPSEKEAGNGNKAGGGSNSGGSRVGTGQTPEMRAKLKAGFARH